MNKVIQIVADSHPTTTTILFALREDGTIWRLTNTDGYVWEQIPIPPTTNERVYSFAQTATEPLK